MTADPYFADKINDACQDGTLMPETMYLELCTSSPTKTAAGTSSGLDRVAVIMADDWISDGAGKLTSSNDLDYGNADHDAIGIHWAELYGAATGGQRYLYGALGSTYDVTTGQPVKFPAGSLTMTIVT
jgi:hypothetical protein